MAQQLNLQHLFAKYVLDGQPTDVDRHFKSSFIPAKDALEIHSNNYRLTLISTLADIFPAICNLVGEECFAAYARQYVKIHPPSSPVLSCYGANFPTYLAAQDLLSSAPYLKDVGRLEWAWNEAFHARNAETLTPDELHHAASYCDEDVTLALHPSVRLIRSPYPVTKIWLMARQPDEAPQEIELNEPENIVVLRPHNNVSFFTVDPGTYSMLVALAQNDGLASAIDEALKTSPEFSTEGSLGNLIARGAFASFTSQQEKQTND